MAEALMIIPMVSALTGTSMMAMLTMGPEGGLIKCVKKKINSLSYDDQIWNKTNTSTGQLSVQFTALTQWMSTMAQYGNTRKRQLNSVRLELSLPIRREFKDNDGKIKVLEPYPLVPHYYHVPRVGMCWRFSLSHFPTLQQDRLKRFPASKNASKREKKKIDKEYSVWIESIGYKATDDVTAFKITWPKNNPTLFNYWNTMIWMLTRYDFNTGLVMENIRAAMQPNPRPLLENDVLALFAQVKMDDLQAVKELKQKEDSMVSPYTSKSLKSTSSNNKKTCQTTTLDVPLSFNYRSNHPKSEKAKKSSRHHHSSDDDDDDDNKNRKVVLVIKQNTSSTTKGKKTNNKDKQQTIDIENSKGLSGLFAKRDKENITPKSISSSQHNIKGKKWLQDDGDDDCELSENPLIRISMSSSQTASMLSRVSMQDNEYSQSQSSRSISSYDSPLAELQAQQKKGNKRNKSEKSMNRKNQQAALNTMNLINTDITARPSVAV